MVKQFLHEDNRGIFNVHVSTKQSFKIHVIKTERKNRKIRNCCWDREDWNNINEQDLTDIYLTLLSSTHRTFS